jgi:hypothetical protein
MVRARIAGVALAAALGLVSGCSTPSGCSSCPGTSFTSRLTGLFRHNSTPVEVVGSPIDGPVIADPGPGCCDGSGGGLPPQSFPPMPQSFGPVPQSFAPPLAPPPRQFNEAQRMPYQP